MKSPCEACHWVKKFFCIFSCKEYLDFNVLEAFPTAPDAVPWIDEIDASIASKAEYIESLLQANENLAYDLRDTRSELDLYKSAEGFGRTENARLHAALFDKDREIEELATARYNEARNVTTLKTYMISLGLTQMPELLPSGPDDEGFYVSKGNKCICKEGPDSVCFEETSKTVLPVIGVRCDYCREVHDPRLACPEYAASINGVERLAPSMECTVEHKDK
jgi:hypothetical protein